MTYTSVQEREEIEFQFGPRLWDAGEGVCCAAFQLGACEHTEVFDPEFDLDEVDERTPEQIIAELADLRESFAKDHGFRDATTERRITRS